MVGLKPVASAKFVWKEVISCFFTDIARDYPQMFPLALLNVGQGLCISQALKYLYPSFQEMIQMTTPFFATVITVALNVSTFNSWAYLSLVPIIGGGIMCSAGEVNFHLIGTLFALSVCVIRCSRYYFFEILTKKLDTFTLTFKVARYTVLCYLAITLATEGESPWRSVYEYQELLAILVFKGILCAAYILTDILMVDVFGSFTTAIMGNIQRILMIVVSAYLFGNSIESVQMAGFAVVLSGVLLKQMKGVEIKVEKVKNA